MLAGKPVIATNAGGATEIIRTGDFGSLVAPGSVTELREAILRLSTDANARKRLGEAGKVHATETFPLAAMFAGIEEVIARFDARSNRRSSTKPAQTGEPAAIRTP